MSINIDVDNGTAKPFTVILSKRDFTHLGQIINISGMKYSAHLNSPMEISFEVSKYADEKLERLWEDISDLKIVYVKEINTYFEINVILNEANYCTKSIKGKSLCECELSQKKLYNIEINSEIDIERSDYEPTKFYNPNNPKASLLNRVLEAMPAYKIKYVAPSLTTIQRTFSVNDQSVYDFLTGECATEFNCIFTFDSTDRSVSVYDLYTVCSDCGYRGDYSDTCPKCGKHNLKYFGEDTTILVSAENLTDEVQFETDVNNVKNCFRLETGDEVMTAAVMSYIPSGGSQLFYISEDQMTDMPQRLVERIKDYNELYDSKVDDYNKVTRNIYACIEKVTYYTSKQMPEITIPDTTASSEAAKLTISDLSPLSLSSLTSYTSLATINSALINYAKVYIRSGFVKLEVDSGTFSYNGSSNGINSGVWSGRLKVTSYSDKNDIAYSSTLNITVNDDYESFMKEKILKSIANDNSDDNSVYDVLNIKSLESFTSALELYSLNRLISFRDAINGVLSVLQEAGGGSTDSELYTPFYLEYYNKLVACNVEIDKRKATIEEWEQKRDEYEKQKDIIQSSLDFKQYLGTDLYNIFSTYIREDTYSNTNYVSDGLSNDEIFKKAQEFLDVARNELIKASYYQHSIQANMYNLLLLDEFMPIVEHFELGNWIRVEADEKIYRLRLVSYDIDFDNLNTINTEFSDVTQTASGMTDVQDILSKASSMSSTYSYVARQASSGHDADMTIEKMRQEGLDSALYQIKNNDSEEIIFGKNGLIASSYDDISDSYSDKKLIITHNIMGYTTDNFKTLKCALGEMKLTIDGVTTYEYGLNSDFCISSKIIAGNIYSANYSSTQTKGTRLNLDEGTFTFADGRIVFDGKKLMIKGVEIDWSTTNESANMWASINANSNSISSEIARATDAENSLSTTITQTADGIKADLKNTKEGLETAISTTAGELKSEVTRATTAEGNLSTRIQQNSNQIVLKADANGSLVTVALGADPKTGSKFSVKADNISLSANDVLDIIAGGILNLTSKNLNIVSDNFKVDSKGNVQCTSLEALELKGNAVEQFNKAIFDSATMRRVQEIIDLLDERMGTVETLLTNNKVIFDLLDQQTYYWASENDRETMWNPENGLSNYVSLDLSGYKYVVVRCKGKITGIPGGQTVNHAWVGLTFSFDPLNNNPDTSVTEIMHYQWDAGEQEIGDDATGMGPNGEGIDKWYNAYIDVSALSGTYTLHCFGYNKSGQAAEGLLWCSKITLTNQGPT